MKSKLSEHIVRYQDQSVFIRTEAGHFGLRQWPNNRPEYLAPRFHKNPIDETIVVLPSAFFHTRIQFPGLHPHQLHADALREVCFPMPRVQAEDDGSVIQLVSQFMVHYQDEFLTYKRARRLPESRLHGYYSIAFGGHITFEDFKPLFNIFNPELGLPYLLRELNEELVLPSDFPPRFLYKGLLYDDSKPVSQQHLGIVFDVELTSNHFDIGERGFLVDAKFESLTQIKARLDEFENWSAMLVKHEDDRRSLQRQ